MSEIEAVYRESFGRFIHAAAAILGDEALAADAVQEAFASAVKSRKGFRSVLTENASHSVDAFSG